jgi:hypothetical protein
MRVVPSLHAREPVIVVLLRHAPAPLFNPAYLVSVSVISAAAVSVVRNTTKIVKSLSVPKSLQSIRLPLENLKPARKFANPSVSVGRSVLDEVNPRPLPLLSAIASTSAPLSDNVRLSVGSSQQ